MPVSTSSTCWASGGPLCIIQRFTYLTLAVVFLVAALVQSGSSLQRGLLWFGALLTLGGLGVAGYQTHLQLQPPTIAATCSASLSYMLETLSVTDVLARLLDAKGDCSDTSFKILGLTLAQASLLIFTALRWCWAQCFSAGPRLRLDLRFLSGPARQETRRTRRRTPRPLRRTARAGLRTR